MLTDEDGPISLDAKTLKKRSGRQRKGKAVGRYQMNVHVDAENQTHIAVLEGRSLLEHYVARPADDISQIHGNIYIGRVENVLPGMEAAFIDISTPKNAVLYRGDVHYDPEDVEQPGNPPRIEQVLKARQLIMCQVTKNPIAHKGARLTQEVSLPGRFVVLVPNSSTFGISKRLPDNERKRLRQVLDKAKPKQHGVIVRTAAENVTREEIERDVARLLGQWEQIEALAKKQNGPALLYREPDMAVRVIREEFNTEYRAVLIDNETLFDEVHDYVAAINPALADRVQYYDSADDPLPLFERFQVTEQLKKGLDRKVWLPVGRFAHHRAHRGADGDRREHRAQRRVVLASRRRCSRTTSRPRSRSHASSGSATSAASSSSTSSTWRSATTATSWSGCSRTPCPATRPAPRCSRSASSASSR